MDKEDVHKDHRKRIRERFLNNGLEDFAPHEVLELLLTFVIPRCDTNLTAHRLIDHFGSISAVMDADIYDLMQIPGVQEITATLLKLTPEVGKRYQIDKFEPTMRFTDVDSIAEYCVYSHLLDTEEAISVMMLDNRMRLLGSEVITSGEGCMVSLDLEKLGEILFRYNARSFVIIHSHPGGDITPSDQDVELTKKIYILMKYFNKVLVEHIIIADGHYVPLIHHMRNVGYEFYDEK